MTKKGTPPKTQEDVLCSCSVDSEPSNIRAELLTSRLKLVRDEVREKIGEPKKYKNHPKPNKNTKRSRSLSPEYELQI